MCSIVASFSIDEIARLIEVNRYRGELSHSVTVLHPDTYAIIAQWRGEGPIGNIRKHAWIDGSYVIVHQQAPTESDASTGVHPAEHMGMQLWHNGLIKAAEVERLRIEQHSSTHWDTELLLGHVFDHDVPLDIDGSFACLLYDKCYPSEFVAFRNELAPLFYDDNLTFSSTLVDGLRSLIPNVMWKIDLKNKTLIEGKHFRTVNNPWYFGEQIVDH